MEDYPSESIHDDLFIMHYNSKIAKLEQGESNHFEPDYSLLFADREKHEAVYSNIMNPNTIWSLPRYNPKSDALELWQTKTIAGSDYFLRDDGVWEEIIGNEDYDPLMSLDDVEKTPYTPYEERGRAMVEREPPVTEYEKRYVRPREHGGGIQPFSAEGEKVLDEETGKELHPDTLMQDSEFAFDLSAQYDQEFNDGRKISHNDIKGKIDKENKMRAVYGTLGKSYPELLPFLNKRGTKGKYNIMMPIVHHRNQIEDIRKYLKHEVLDRARDPDDTSIQLGRRGLHSPQTTGAGDFETAGEMNILSRDDVEANEALNKLTVDEAVEKELEKQGVDPDEVFYEQKLLDNLIDNINVELGGRFEEDIESIFELAVSGNVRYVNMPIEIYQKLHEPLGAGVDEDGNDMPFKARSDEDEESVKYFMERIKEGEFMNPVKLVYNPLTNSVHGHQGRHRGEAAKRSGIKNIPVRIEFDPDAFTYKSEYGFPPAFRYSDYDHSYLNIGSQSGLPISVQDMADWNDLYRRFWGKGYLFSTDVLTTGEKEYGWHTEKIGHNINRDPSYRNTEMAKFEEVLFQKQIGKLQHKANAISGARAPAELDDALDDFWIEDDWKDIPDVPQSPRYFYDGVIPKGIIINPNAKSRSGRDIVRRFDNVFTQLDVNNLRHKTNTPEDKAAFNESLDKFHEMLANNWEIKQYFDELEKPYAEFNKELKNAVLSGLVRTVHRMMPIKELTRMIKYDSLVAPSRRGRKRAIFEFISTSISPHAAMDDSQPFAAEGGITVEFSLEYLMRMAEKQAPEGEHIMPREYTAMPTEMLGENPDPKVWGTEKRDSKLPWAMAKELEYPFPLNTSIDGGRVISSITVDLGNYESIEKTLRDIDMDKEADMYLKWMSEKGGYHDRAERVKFFNQKVRYSKNVPIMISMLDKIDRKVQETTGLADLNFGFGTLKEYRIPVRFKFERYQSGFNAVIEGSEYNQNRDEMEYKSALDMMMSKDVSVTREPDADRRLTHYTAMSLNKIIPRKGERLKMKIAEGIVRDGIAKTVEKHKIDGVREVVIGGSTAKDTFLSGSSGSDLDVFIIFEYFIKQEMIDHYVRLIGKEVLLPLSGKKFNWVYPEGHSKDLKDIPAEGRMYFEKYGVQGITDEGETFSHVYPEGYIDFSHLEHDTIAGEDDKRLQDMVEMNEDMRKQYGSNEQPNIEVQFLGVSHVSPQHVANGRNGTINKDKNSPTYGQIITNGMKTGNDRSPLHVAYMKKALKGKENEVRLLKNFFKEAKVYDSSGKTRGFSGYATEVLIDELDTFNGVLEYFANLKPYSKIDKTGESGEMDTMFQLVDPTDKNRNLASAFSDSAGTDTVRKNHKLARLVKTAKHMLETGELPKITRSEMEAITIQFPIKDQDENAAYEQLYHVAAKLNAMIGRGDFRTANATEVISEGFISDLPRVKVLVDSVRGQNKMEKLEAMEEGNRVIPDEFVGKKFARISIGFWEDWHGKKGDNQNMNLPKEYWRKGIAADQKQHLIDGWHKAQDKKGVKQEDRKVVDGFWSTKETRTDIWIGQWLKQQLNFNLQNLGLGTIVDPNLSYFEDITGGDRFGKPEISIGAGAEESRRQYKLDDKERKARGIDQSKIWKLSQISYEKNESFENITDEPMKWASLSTSEKDAIHQAKFKEREAKRKKKNV